MQGFFKVKAITNLDEAKVGDIIGESDYSCLTPEGKFVQLEYVDEDKQSKIPYDVKPGIYTLAYSQIEGFKLEETSFTNDKILEDFLHTQDIEAKANSFFKNIHKYKEFGIDVAKRNMLLHGPGGGGKTSAIARVCNNYVKDKETIVVLYPTEKYEATMVKDFVKRFDYDKHIVKRLILVMEDVGGVEMEEHRRGSDPGLLSLLDNQEKTFKVPTLIIATTNFPEVFMANLTNRPGRFDDKIKVDYPSSEAKVKLLEFFCKTSIDNEVKKLLASAKSKPLTPAHLKEVVIRSAIHDKTLLEALKEVVQEVEEYTKGFSEKGGVGLGL